MTENPFAALDVQPAQPGKPTSGPNPFRWMRILGIVSVLFVLVVLFLPAVTRGPSVRRTARRVQCMNHLKQIRLALELYHDEYHALPAAYTTDANGQKLHSWRTLILPYMKLAALHNQIDLSKPWNDPVNSAVSSQMPEVYRCPEADLPAGMTTYLGAVGEDFCFHPTSPRSLKEFSDGLSETLMVFEVSPKNAVAWMSPQDADLESIMSLNSESGLSRSGGFLGVMGDFTVRFLPADLPPATRKALLTIRGGELIEGY